MLASLRARLLATYLLLAALVLAIVTAGLLIYLVRSPLADRQTSQRLRLAASLITSRGAESLLNAGPGQLQAALQRLDQVAQARALLIDSEGQVLADSRAQDPLPARLPERIRLFASAASGTLRDASGQVWIYQIAATGSGRYLMLAAARPALRLAGLLRDDLVPPLVRAGLVALVLSALLAWMMSRWVAAPLKHMAEAASAVAAGDFQHPLPTQGPSEVKSFAAAFRNMIQRVQASAIAQRDFVANVSHELKTPLTSIQGFAQALIDGAAGDQAGQQRAASVILDESKRLHRLVDDLLQLARMDAGQGEFRREALDLKLLLEGIVERFRLRQGEGGVGINADLPSFPVVIGDGDRLAQVFTNLIDNALKHSPPQGQVSLTGERGHGWVVVHISDQGPGIAPEELSRIFERFYQVDKARSGGAGRGSGLGLAISREIVRAHGGEILVQSQLGGGSRFSVRLPVARPTDETLASRRR
jgi:two-component system OmpR family sensor kinase